MTNVRLCLFKSSRRSEYTQENLRLLSGEVDDELDISYKDRWLGDDLRDRPPEAGEPVILVLADPPYAKSFPIRRAEVVESSSGEDTLRLRLRLGPRLAADLNRWRPLVHDGPNPETGQFATRLAVDEGVVEEVADGEAELRAWKRQIDAVSHGDGYARVAFLRVGNVSEVGSEPLPAPLRLTSGRTYQVDVIAYNPHLDGDTLAALRLVAFPEPSVVDVAMDAQPIPADGTITLMLLPQDEGPASLEFNVSRGAEFWYALQLGWMTIAPQLFAGPDAAAVAPVRTGSVSAGSGGAGPVSAESSTPAPDVLPRPTEDPATPLLRGYMLLRGPNAVPAELRLRLLDELLLAAPRSDRLLEQRGIVLFDLGRWSEAAEVLDGLTSSVLGAEGRTTLVLSWFMQGRLPSSIDRVRIAEFSRDEWFDALLDASGTLSIADQVAVARLLADSVLTEDRASRWTERLATGPDLSRHDRLELLQIWQLADPVAAAAGLNGLVEAGNVELTDPTLASLAFELAVEARRMRLARRAAFELIAHHEARKDVDGLEALLDEVMTKLGGMDRRELGEEIVLAIADLADDDAEIDRALDAAADLIEDLRQRGELDSAARIARFAAANQRRASKRVRHHIRDVQARLDEAFEESDTIRRFEEARRRELDEDLRDIVGGKRVMVVGANEQPWWPDVRKEFGFVATSEWVSTERRKSPNLDRLIKRLDNLDLLIVQVGRISHKTSEPLMKAAKDRDVQIISVPRPTRDAFTMSLRVGLVEGESMRASRDGVSLGGIDLDALIEEGRRGS